MRQLSSKAGHRERHFLSVTLIGANTADLIQSDGHIAGLKLTAGASLVVCDYDDDPPPVVVEQYLAMDATGTLWLEFDADAWDSSISFAPGTSVSRGSTLELTFDPNVNFALQIGCTIDRFSWTGVMPTGAFNVTSPYTWKLFHSPDRPSVLKFKFTGLFKI